MYGSKWRSLLTLRNQGSLVLVGIKSASDIGVAVIEAIGDKPSGCNGSGGQQNWLHPLQIDSLVLAAAS